MIEDLLIGSYLWVKAAHIVAVVSWMAGLLYLPRLFVYHVERGTPGSEVSETFKVMEMKLYRFIMNPAMMVSWVLGLWLAAIPGVIGGWFLGKLAAVIAMTWFHIWLGKRRKEFLADENVRSGRTYRLMNEVPTVLLIAIAVLVIVKPF
ncbi:protoporphyrinogen oxidase HemJ [Pontivivens ytuae]|uniref:Protoporphyrinogen IX oxidase n=1 Tax=Pontivivens ytuae TaxID=2789856 RepID=A0A7S9LVF1_9RHOB|nr:protoporphyrinogen oxidase HemJ [Pontivivens ytuae]QPH55888.1 protoporphyrinogen oxidase HemJ [Pontivivens ytuae]